MLRRGVAFLDAGRRRSAPSRVDRLEGEGAQGRRVRVAGCGQWERELA